MSGRPLPAGVSMGLWLLNEACGLAHCDATVTNHDQGEIAVMRVKHNRTKGEVRSARSEARVALERWLRETHGLEALG